MSVSEHLPRLNVDNEVFTVEGELPDECIISIQTTVKALRNIKTNKASGPDNTPAWVLKYHAALASDAERRRSPSLADKVLRRTTGSSADCYL